MLKSIKNYVIDYFNMHADVNLYYHNLQHTEGVVARAKTLCKHYELSDTDKFVILTACWFHDIGYLTAPGHHEAKSADLAESFLIHNQLDDESVAAVRSCILATKLPQAAKNLKEQITCDADLYELGTPEFFKNDKLLWKESQATSQEQINKLEWKKRTVTFLEKHQFHTEYARSMLDEQKERNISQLKKKIKEMELSNQNNSSKKRDQQEEKYKEADVDLRMEKKKVRPEKGIETMFRISSSNHQRLSDMADRKAHIMITVNSIILSAVIGLVFRRLDAYGFLILPSFLLLAISVLAITFSILSTRPTIPHGTFSSEALNEKKVNLLFFGNYYKMGVEVYAAGMRKMMEDSDFLYGSLIHDIYAQGVVLGKKYHFLRISYNIFMFGLIAAVITFGITFLINGHAQVPPATPAVNGLNK